MKTILKYKDILLIITYNESNIHIEDSYRINQKHLMRRILVDIVDKAAKNDMFYKRSIESWINEWVAHNWLYKHSIKQDRTRSVDLNEDEKCWKRLGYFLIYKLFCR